MHRWGDMLALAALPLVGVGLFAPASSEAGPAATASAAAKHSAGGAPRCLGRRATIVVGKRSAKGTSKADVIVVVNPLGARVEGGGGGDRICGGPGKDVLRGGRGNDRLAGAGVDRLVGGKGVDGFQTKGRRVRTDLALGELLNGRRKTVEQRVRARRSTVELPAGAAGPVSGDPTGRQTVVLRDGAEAPRVGGVLAIAASASQDGLLGRVIARKRLSGGRVTITTVPATVDKAYSVFMVRFAGTLAELERTGGAGISSLPAARASGFLGLLKGAAGRFSCTRNALDTRHPDPIKIDVDLSSAHVDGSADLNIANPAIAFNLVARPTIDVSAKFATGGSCRADFPAAHIPVGTTPLMLVIGPYLKADATASVSARYRLDTRVNLGFVRSKRGGNTDARVFKVEGAPTITGSGKLTAGLGLSAQMTLGGRVGIGGEIGPQASVEAKSTTGPTGVTTCITGTSALRVGLVATADVFVAKWSFTLAQGTFLDRTWFDRCVPGNGGGGPPGGGGGPGPPAGSPPSGTFKSVSTGYNYACGVRTDDTIACWGENGHGQASPLSGTFKSVSSGYWHACGVRTDDTIACWGGISCAPLPDDAVGCQGENSSMQSVPSGSFKSVSAGDVGYTCGVRSDASIACWGTEYTDLALDEYPSSPVPPGTFESVSTGFAGACGVRTDATIACWGIDWNGVVSFVPSGAFRSVSVSAGSTACAIRSDDSLTCWGTNWNGQASSPPGSFESVSASTHHVCAVRTDGTIACWGDDEGGQTSPPAGSYESVSAGNSHSCAVRTNGSITCWGPATD